MGKKRRWMVIAAVTMEALLGCIQENCPAICVEDPLYTEIRDKIYEVDGMENYQITFYEQEQFAILKKVQGEFAFDDEHFEVFYYRFLL